MVYYKMIEPAVLSGGPFSQGLYATRLISGIHFIALVILISPASVSAAGIAAHRGDHTSAPENTVPAFIAAVKAGAQQVEFDVRSTRDGELVIMHDDTVDRTTNGKGRIADLTLNEIRALDAGMKFGAPFKGTKIPTFREALAAIPESVLINAHIGGGEETAAETARIIREMGRLRQCFITIGDTQNSLGRTARSAAPGILICKGAAADKPVTEETVTLGDNCGGSSVVLDERADFIQLFYWKPEMPPIERLRESVRALHAMGVKVIYCCASDETKIRTLAGADVDYILTDDVKLCRDVLKAMESIRPETKRTFGTVKPGESHDSSPPGER